MRTLSFARLALIMAALSQAETYMPTGSFSTADLGHSGASSTLMEGSDTNNGKLTTLNMTMDHAARLGR